MQGWPSNPAGFFVISICLCATLCTAQTINISGVVVDTADIGIPGATVRLEKADISAITGPDGSFALTGSVAVTQPGANGRIMGLSPILVQKGKITLTLSGIALVGISIHDVSGRQLYSNKRAYGSGTHAIVAPLQSSGIFIYKVNIGNESYSFKSSPFGTVSAERSVASGNSSALAKQAKTTAVIADVISVVKEGQINYRASIKTSDTTGIVVKMIPNAGDVTDVDGNVYQSVRIGNQIWTVENLRTTKYNDGSAIVKAPDSSEWDGLRTGAYCYYDNDSAANAEKYGALYNWYVVEPSNPKQIAPAGWHVPTDAEWKQLKEYLMDNGYNWDGTTTGDKIGSSLAAQTDWISSNGSEEGEDGNALSSKNRTGFSALPGGCRCYDGSFRYQGSNGGWWSATEYDASLAYYRYLSCGYEHLLRHYYYYYSYYYYYKSWGYSLRLVRD